LVLLDQGLFYIDSGNRKNRIMVRGEPAEEAQRLDGAGGVLDPELGPEDSVFREFRVRKELAWSTLNLPTTV
jgi:hypothetical protein